MKNVFLSIIVIFTYLFSNSILAQGYLTTQGKEIVDEQGENFILKGMGLGGWMLQEGYMMQTSGFANAQYQIKEKIAELVGDEKMNQFYDAWLANHVRKSDIDSLKAWGFNSVRLPMHYNLFTLPIEEEPVENENTWLEKGFVLTDSLISWCSQNEMYVILDLHAAPGGQGYDQAISDYDPTKPSIFESLENRLKAASLWRKIAQRYVDEPWVAGYDLLNEPNWNTSGNILRSIYRMMTDSIRSVDTKHIIFIEGNWFANDFSGLTPPWDDNMVYSPHKYWSINDDASIQWVLDMREEYDVPLYLGETGENSNTWFHDAIALFDKHNIGWAWWPMKKVESIAGPLSITKSEEYQMLLDYWNNGGSAPTEDFTFNTLMDLTELTKIENCRFQKDVIDAMFRQQTTNETTPFRDQSIPGVIYASDFDMGTLGQAYFDTDYGNYNVSTGIYTPWNTGWAYRNDGVDIETSNDSINTNGYTVGWLVDEEWMQYDINITESGLYDIELRIAGGLPGGQLHFEIDGSDITGIVSVPNTGGWYEWESVMVENVYLSTSNQKLKFYVDKSGFNLNSFSFVKSGESESISTEFLSGVTLDENRVQLSINKPLIGPIEDQLSQFELFVDGVSIDIAKLSVAADNTRLIILEVSTPLTSKDNITVSYGGSQIEAFDGSDLSIFSMEPVKNTLIKLHEIPGRIEAEDYYFQSGIQVENCTDVGGGQNIGFLDLGDYLDYYVSIDKPGTYKVSYRTAAESESGSVTLQWIDSNNQVVDLHSINFEATGGWQNWITTDKLVEFTEAGQQQLRLLITSPLFNVNWIQFDIVSDIESLDIHNSISISPNPTSGIIKVDDLLIHNEPIEISIINEMGKLVFRKKQASGLPLELDLSHLENGCYFVQYRCFKSMIHTDRLIILK